MPSEQPLAMHLRLAVLFGYNGASFNGLERSKGGRTVEGEILNAVASLMGQADPAKKVTLVNISRATTTEEGEHASRQPAQIPTPAALNAILPSTIRVFKILNPAEGFSARRTCDARTYEYLIPTYAFSPPPHETGYAHSYEEELAAADLERLFPASEGPTGKLFTTMARGKKSEPELNPSSPVNVSRVTSETAPMSSPSASLNPFSRLFETLSRGRKSEKRDKSQEKETSHSYSEPSSRSRSAPAPLPKAESNIEFDEESSLGPVFLDPINIPQPTEESLSLKRRYRISAEQLDMLRHIVAIFRGTHNFHNYIPGATFDDDRCYMHVLSIEMSDPEVHFNMEWIRIKVQAKAFARFQIRRMIALAILVIRTNTPRSVVANSFGFAQIEIPEAPAIGLICDEVFYLDYNENPNLSDQNRVSFDSEKAVIEKFRKSQIHDWIYREEQEFMYFEAWLRSIDRFAFLYHYYLNNRGLIKPRKEFLNPNAVPTR